MTDTDPSTTHIMVDLETMGTSPRAPIISIGACAFELHGETILDSFHVGVTLDSNMMLGRHPDAATINWWMAVERQEARLAYDNLEKVDLFTALVGLADWVASRECEQVYVWGNGAGFDNVILATAYKDAGVTPFWPFWNDRCYRTIKSLAPDIKIDRNGLTHHDALGDAIAQTKHLQRIIRATS